VSERCRLCNDELPANDADWAVAHYQGHIAADTRRMADSMRAQLELVRSISNSSFLNPRGPGESAADAAVCRNGGA